MIFISIRSTKEQRTLRHRQCFECGEWMDKGEYYINHQFRYDRTILSMYFHKSCFSRKALLNDILTNETP